MYECKHGCGYGSEHRGTMNLHEKFHCKKMQPVSQTVCECGDGGKWQFLSKVDPAHQRAAEAGYERICTTCGELV